MRLSDPTWRDAVIKQVKEKLAKAEKFRQIIQPVQQKCTDDDIAILKEAKSKFSEFSWPDRICWKHFD